MRRVLGQIQDPPSLLVRRERGSPLAAKPNFASLLRCRWPPDTAFELDQVRSTMDGVQGLQGARGCQALSQTAGPAGCCSACPLLCPESFKTTFRAVADWTAVT